MGQSDRVRKQFGPVATAYATSSFHAHGPDLARLVTEAGFIGTEVVLDLGCGAGHTALACAGRAARVVGVDLTPEMVGVASFLAEQRGVLNASFCVADVEALPFDDHSFDVVTSRVSAHHYRNVAKALAEAFRVLHFGGHILILDSITPGNRTVDTFLNCIELLRDSSHIRDYRALEWRQMLADAGFEPELVDRFALDLDGEEWVQRINTPPAKVAMLQQLFAEAEPQARDALQIRDGPWGLTLPLALFRGTRMH